MPKRPDAELVETSKFHEFKFHIMRGRMESIIFYDLQIDLTNTLAFLEKYNEGREEKDKLTLFQIYLAAGVRTIVFRPKMNRFVSGGRLWQKNQILISFVVNKEKTDEGEEIVAMIDFDPFETLETVKKKVTAHLDEARYGENKTDKDIKFFGALPRWVIRLIFRFVQWMDEHNHPIYSITKDMPLWCSVFIAHLGSLGMDAVYHHLFELGTSSLFATIGKIHKAAVVNQETEEIEIKKVLDIRLSFDDRISDGVYATNSVHLLKDLIENPEPLLDPPELTPEQLDRLKLKKIKP